MTARRSQGSEFGEGLRPIPYAVVKVTTRKFVYTGVTRAKRVVLHAPGDAAKAVESQALRQSGTRDGIREAR